MKTRWTVLPILALFALSSLACGGGGGSAQKGGGQESHGPDGAQSHASEAGHSTPAAQPAATAGGGMTAVVKGTVKFTGKAPAMEKIKMDADPVCKGLHASPVVKQDVVVNGNGTLQWVMVYVKSGLEGRKFPTPSTPVVLDQKGCMYSPRVFGMMAGQGVKILNSDATLHNVHSVPKVNKAFNVGMPKVGEITKNFDTPEEPFRIKCDVHNWMSSYCGVFDHPFYSVTNETGAFQLSGLPAGTYTIVAWHEKFGTQEMSVTVGDGESKDVVFTFTGA